MRRRFFVRVALTAALLTTTATSGFAQNTETKPRPSPLGFSPRSRAVELAAEARAVAVPTPESARGWLRTLTEEPHVAGTHADYKTALFVRDRLRAWGWTADLAEYEVLLNYPAGTPILELLRPDRAALPLTEKPNPADKDSDSPDAFPAFHGYGVSGDVKGQVVYANYGQPEDFSALEKLGVDVKGKIVLVRYGGIFRGLKVRNAQKRGAAGVLIYSDPADDGFARGDVYPLGPYRPGSALQRGSVQFLSLGPGDPSTPEGPSVKGAKRLPTDPRHGFPLDDEAHNQQDLPGGPPVHVASVKEWEQASSQKRSDYFATIPSLPISYDAARPILAALGGPNVPSGWQGGLPLPYHVGPGPAEVRFAIQMEYRVRTIWNVIATLKGSVEPDRWVLIGNHRDAWVYGAVDPGSGTAATLETCRALGAAVKAGWSPRRTIVYASWDAEEYGLVGSTEWADEHAKELDTKAVLLLNVDSAVGGHELDMDGVPSSRDLLLDSAGAVTDVRSGKSLRDVWTEKKRGQWATGAPIDFYDPLWDASTADPTLPPGTASALAPTRPAVVFSPQLNALGSGSDYTAFLDHLAIPSVDVGFGGGYGVYHSVFDNFFWMEKFCDPEFLTHATAARLYTVIAMRAAGAEVVPFTFTPYGEALREYLDDLRRMVERRARGTPPGAPRPMEFAGLDGLVKSIRSFRAAAESLDRATAELSAHDGLEPARLARLNNALQRVERAFLIPGGLPGRPWFKHAIYAPGLTTGYASWPLPGVRQAVIDNDSALLAAQVPALVRRIDAATQALGTAEAEAKGVLQAVVRGPRRMSSPVEIGTAYE
jgi:N-acetylated-alpha-linked acidic dipeptidase